MVDERKDGEGMTLGEHLDELRTRLFRGVVVVLVLFGVAWGYRDVLWDVLLGPYDHFIEMFEEDWTDELEERLEADPSLPRTDFFLTADPDDQRIVPNLSIPKRPMVTGGSEGFLFKLKGSLYVAFFVGGPYLLWQLWGFIAAGLYKSEKSVVLAYFPASLGLFFSGIAFGYYVLVPYALFFLAVEAPPDEAALGYRLSEYFTFLSSLCLALGLVFQLPILQTVLARIGLVDWRAYKRYRGHFALAALVIAAILTPPDPVTQMLMAGPMVILWEIGIWTSRLTAPPPVIPEGEELA